MKAKVDKDLCAGTGLCEEICPKVFKVNDEGISEVQVDEVPEDLQDSCREAADSCPTTAIEIED